MRKGYIFLCAFIASISAYAQGLYTQSFEATGDNWTYSASPATYNVSGDVWAAVSSLGSIASASSGAEFWGMQDLENPNGGGAFFHELSFDTLSTVNLTNVKISFDYNVVGFDTGDQLKYELILDDVAQGEMVLFAGASGGASSASWETMTLNINDTVNSVAIKLMGKQNGGSDYAGFDNVMLDTGATVTPPVPSVPLYSIAQVTGVNANGVPDSLNVNCAIEGTVFSIDFDGNTGISFYMQDATDGINVFNFNDVDAYVVTSGDELYMEGEIGQYNGLTQFEPDTIYVKSSGNPLPTPSIVSKLDEATEGKYIQLNGFYVADPTQWPTSNSANVDITNGTDTLTMRIDSDTDIDGTPAPTGLLNIRGAGAQYDNSSPYTSGYQIFPSSLMDIMTGGIGTPTLPLYTIAQIRTEDANGVADSLNVTCAITGTVFTTDFDGNTGISFYVQDGTAGINVFNFNDVDNYVVNAGDSLYLEGDIAQYNGLTEFVPDSIYVISTGNMVYGPMLVTMLDGTNEGSYVQLNGVTLADATQWPASGSGNVDIVLGTDTMTMRIDGDTDIDGSPAPVGAFDVRGAVGQYDNSTPYTSGYQLFPSSLMDIMTQGGSTTPSAYFISDITGVDANGLPDSLNVVCAITGLVSGDNLNGTGVEFWFIDSVNSDGLLVRNTNPSFNGYTVTEGDKLWVHGEVDFYNGLLQFVPDSIMVISSGNTLPAPNTTSVLDESKEGRLLEMQYMSYVSGTWPNPGSSTNITITDGTNNFTMRIDGGTDVADSITAAPTGLFHVRGHGGQFDASSPYTSGYQILPRYSIDIIPVAVTSPTINFTTGQQYVSEGDGTVPVQMIIGPTSPNVEMVKVYVMDGTTVTGGEYTTTPSKVMDTITLSVAAGADTISFDVNIVDDNVLEDNDTIFFSIATVSSGLAVGPLATQDFIIADNDVYIPSYSISQINTLDADYLLDSMNVYCKLTGTVLGVDLQGTVSTNVQFTIHDGTGGFGVFAGTPTGYVVNEGDEVRLIGTLSMFNGLAQINPDSIVYISSGNPLPTPTVVTTLDESTESNLARINNVYIVDPTQWTNAGSGFNVDITDGTNTWQLRIDNEVDLYTQPAPIGTFDVVGIGGQFDNSAPHNSGYQLLPRYTADIIYPQPYKYQLSVSELMAGSADPNANVNDDWFEIYNYGTDPINLNGFSFDDDSENPGTQVFGNITIAGGEAIVVWRGDLANKADFEATWRMMNTVPQIITKDDLTGSGSFPNFSQSGDMCVLYDTSMVPVEICKAQYTSALAGRSVEFDTNCTVAGNAADGVNGAYYSNGGDQGSPGNVTPGIGIYENALEGVEVYPNPASGILNISLENNTTTHVKVVDMTGRTLIAKEVATGSIQLNVSSLNSGAYILVVEQGKGVHHETIVIR